MIMVITQGDAVAEWNNAAGKFIGNKDLAYSLNLIFTAFARIGNNSFQNIIDDSSAYGYTITAYEPDVIPEGVLDGI